MRLQIITLLAMSAGVCHGQGVFPLERVSAIDHGEINLIRGAHTQISHTPAEGVSYPEARLTKPLFGEFTFRGKTHRFMIDGQGEADAPTYDTLHFDLNADGDLRNDPPLGVMQLPRHAASGWGNQTRVHFDFIDLPRAEGAVPLRVFTALVMGGGSLNLFIVVSEEAWRGEVLLGEKRFHALLSQPDLSTGSYGNGTVVQMWPWGREQPTFRGGFDGDSIRTMRQEGEDYYTFACSPEGDRLTVTRYDGPMGDFRLGTGGRSVDKLRLRGTLRSAEHSLGLEEDSAAGYRIPAGDYLPSYMTAQFGDVSIAFSDNSHSDGQERGRKPERVYGIRVRADEPFVLDFADRPAVVFASPAKDRVYRPGEQVRIAAVLVDEKLDVMIRRIEDLSGAKEQKRMHQGRQVTAYDVRFPMHPNVVVTDSSGREVYNGVMPFG